MKNQKGFTLVEMIIAIGILMIASGFILQIFMTAKTMNIRAHAVDQSVSLATSFVETVKAEPVTSVEAIGLHMADTMQTQASENTLEVSQYYDQNWNLMSPAAKAQPSYILTGTLKEEPADKLLQIKVEIKELKQDQTEKSIYTLEAATALKGGDVHE